MRTSMAVGMVVMLAVAVTPVLADDGDAILGLWATEPDAVDGNGHVEVFKENGRYHGRLVWLEKPEYNPDDPQGMAGQTKVDRENPDEGLRTRPLIGLLVMEGFVFNGKDLWHEGTIYDPDNGKTYKCKVRLGDHGELRVRGYIGVSLLGRTSTWTRVSP